MDAIESQYWDIKTTNAEIEQEALTLKRDFWNLKLAALKNEITKNRSHIANSKEALLNTGDLACMYCEHSMLPSTAEICADCIDHSNFLPKQGK